jgi:hypothetical protein
MKKYLPPLLVFTMLTLGVLAVILSSPTQNPSPSDSPTPSSITNADAASFLLERFQLQRPDASTIIEYQCADQLFYMSATADGRTHYYFDASGEYTCTSASSATAKNGINCGERFKISGCTATLLWPRK